MENETKSSVMDGWKTLRQLQEEVDAENAAASELAHVTEPAPPISPEGFEEALVKQAAEAPLGNPEDQAAAMFQKHALRLVQYIPYMKKNELVRIILHAGLHPLYTNKKKLKNETEELIAHDLEQLLLCKAIMSIQVAAEDMQTKDKELVKGTDVPEEQTIAEEPAKTVAEATGE